MLQMAAAVMDGKTSSITANVSLGLFSVAAGSASVGPKGLNLPKTFWSFALRRILLHHAYLRFYPSRYQVIHNK